MKRIFFAILFAIPALIAQAQSNSSKEPYITRSLTNEQFSKIDVSTAHGDIIVSRSEPADARVEVYIRGNGVGDDRISKEEIQSRLSQQYDFEVSVSNGALVAFARAKNNNANNRITLNWKKGLRISFRIYTSVAVANDLKTSHGDIDLSGMDGDQQLSTSHGDIRVEKITGEVKGSTSHGDVSVKTVTNGVDMSTSHGNIHADHCDGAIRLATSKGDIGLNTLKGKIRAHTSHGDVQGDALTGDLVAVTSHGNIGITNLDASVESSTSHGDITLQLPKGKGIDIDLHGKRISLDKMENFSGSKESRSMKGSLNGGGMLVKADTNHGSVNLQFR